MKKKNNLKIIISIVNYVNHAKIYVWHVLNDFLVTWQLTFT